jgi:predicted transposase YbfD/YdcC
MGCQKEIVKLIAEQNADYIITLKKNQGQLYKNVEQLFKEAIRTGFQGIERSAYHTRVQAHGREEIRHYLMLNDIDKRVDPTNKWQNLKSIGLVESVRTMNGKTTVETRYYITSLPKDAELFAQSVRSHWGIENSLHWVLDVALNEDDCRIRKDNAPENFAVMRRLAVNLLGREKTHKGGVKNKQFLAAMDNEYLIKVLAAA